MGDCQRLDEATFDKMPSWQKVSAPVSNFARVMGVSRCDADFYTVLNDIK